MRRSFPPGARRSKFGAVRTEVDGVTFASKAEARRYGELKLLWKAGTLATLELQPSFDLIVSGVKVGRYVADFSYHKPDGELVVEDVKGMPTPVYKLKKRLVAALYGIQIQEIR